MKVLVVDDHPLILEALRQVLRDLDPDMQVIAAADPDQAIARANEHEDLGLLLLDLALPGRNGLDLLPQLRKVRPELPIVVLSATEDGPTVLRAISEGAMGFIPKSARPEVLLAALRLVFSGAVYLPPTAFGAGNGPVPEVAASPATMRDPREVGLTQRQAEVLALLVQGKSNKLICRALNLAEGTVKIHVTAILRALGVTNRTEAVVAVSRLGLRLEPFLPTPVPAR